jgi:hypothetical protein
MRVVLWDTCRNRLESCLSASQTIECETLLGRFCRYACRQFFPLERQPVALELAYLVAILRRLRHTLEYVEDDLSPGADLYIFRPTLGALDAALDAIDEARRLAPRAQLLVIGSVAGRWPELFTSRGATVIKGDAEQLPRHLDAVLNCDKAVVNVGCVDDPDSLPWPDWTWFECQRFRMPGDFHSFPVALVEHSRRIGSAGQPSPAAAPRLRYRPAERVVSEMRHQIQTHDFEAFLFCDPAFGADCPRTRQLLHLMQRLPRPIEFSIHARPADLTDDLLERAAAAGLATVRFEVLLSKTLGDDAYKLDAGQLQSYCRLTQRCRSLGVRTLARIQLPVSDSPQRQWAQVLRFADMLDTTFVELALKPPAEWKPVGDRPERYKIAAWNRYYLRWKYWRQQLGLLLPSIEPRTADGRNPPLNADAAHRHTPKPLGGVEIIQRTRGLRKDSPHQRSVRRAPNPHQQD